MDELLKIKAIEELRLILVNIYIEKKKSIRNQHYEKAADMRDKEKEILKQLDVLKKELHEIRRKSTNNENRYFDDL